MRILNTIIIISMFLFYGCTHVEKSNIHISEFSTGEQLSSSDWDISFSDSSTFFANNKKDVRITVQGVRDTIYSIYFNEITKNEFDSIEKEISLILKVKPCVFVNKMESGLEIDGMTYFWMDSVSGDRVSLYQRNIEGEVSRSMIVENEKLINAYQKNQERSLKITEPLYLE